MTWALTPANLAPGEKFRLLFVTSSRTNGRPGRIATYDEFVQQAAADGSVALRPFSQHFRVVASTETDDARDHTLTLFSPSDRGVQIYWLGGAKVADDYRDFYDGSWSSHEPRDPDGEPLAADIEVLTGSESDGTKADGLHLGQRDGEVRGGSPGKAGSELSDTGLLLDSDSPSRLYAISAIFTVVPAPATKLALSLAEANGAELTFSYEADLDPTSVPDPADFSVMVAGSPASVAEVSISGRAVTLTLASAVGIGDVVTASYTPGAKPVRTVLGRLIAGFSDFAVTNNTQPTLSINAPRTVEPDTGETAFLDFEVVLSPAADAAVTVDYAISEAGTATSGTDYEPLTGGTLTFAPDDTRRTVRVTVVGDEREEDDETIVLELTNAVNAALRGGGTTLAGTGTIIDDEAPAAGEVPVTWGLAPSGLIPGAKFRLLLVTSTGRNGRPAATLPYDRHVRSAASSGRAALEPFGAGFRALVSTETDDARDHTATTFSTSDPGVPIYWVGGARVAADYRELYGGSWDSNEPRDENGDLVAADIRVFTGSESDGTKAAGGFHIGHPDADVRSGSPGKNGSEMSDGLLGSKTSARLYGLSAVFTLAPAPSTMLERVATVVNWSELTLTYGSDLDSDYTPPPAEFNVMVDGVAATVVEVSVSGSRLILTLAEPVPIGGTVTAEYTAGTRRLRSVLGVLVSDFPLSAVQNDTQAQITVTAPRVAEGDAGEERSLDFEVSLRPAVAYEVTVEYSDVSADEGTATSGSDYRPLNAGTLTFAPYETSQSVRVTVLGDAVPEPDETVVLRLSDPTNAAFQTGGTTLDTEGKIGNDDVPVQEVLSTWGLVPSDIAIGSSFRLLFVTSSSTRGVFSQIDRYDGHVRDSASTGRAAIRPFSEHLWALISTAEVDAREHTVTGFTTTSPGVPIYWLNGGRVANDYRDFYDGNWASNSPVDELGDDAGADVAVFTGSASDGTRDPSGLYAGSLLAEDIRLGKPRVPGSEIASQDASELRGSEPVYGLSGVFTVVAPTGAIVPLVSATAQDESLTLTYGEELDFDSLPTPENFTVTVSGAPRAVTQVTITGSSVNLRLASELVLGEAVAVSYAAGTNPLRSQAGVHVAALSGFVVENLTKRKLLIGATAAFEGDPLEFSATLSPASDQTVTVQYRTESGTATLGLDFVETTGTLTFAPGETSHAFTVTTIQDDLDEPNETVALVLSNATNLVFADDQTEVTLVATILDDDETVPLRVPPTWELVPSGLADGDAFRLLFVSSEAAEAVTESIALYDRHVIDAAAAGDGAIRAVSQFFWVLASVAGIDARDYTTTTHTNVDLGVPIYWLGGARVADNYEDFYDGEWASNSPTDEFGERVPAGAEVFTGSNSDGTKDSDGRHLGTLVQGAVTVGKPGAKGLELDADERKLKTSKRPLYGLSGVFIVDKDASVPESATEATLEISPAAVEEGSDAATVSLTLNLARPARTDQEWEIQIRDETAFSPDDFVAAPRIQTVSMASGETSAHGTFEISTTQEPEGIPECPESVLVRAVGTTDSGLRVTSASARLSVIDAEATEAFCGPPADGGTVVLAPSGARNPDDSTLGPSTEMPDTGPPERLGTPAEFAVWTDRAGYGPGQQVRLFRSVDPKTDGGSYTFFYYLENTRTGARRYFAPGIRSTGLEPTVVDQYGMGEGSFRPAGFEPAVRDLIWSGMAPGIGAWRFVAEVRSANATQVMKVSHARFVVSAGEPRPIGDPDEPLVLTADRTLYSAIVYELRGPVRVGPGATLTVEAGTLVKALGPDAMLIVERGGRIEVQGTRRDPVVMTCDAPVGLREPGCWGGLAVLGGAPVDPGDVVSGQSPADAGRQYGGDAPDDSSGSLRFLRVEFAGGGTEGTSPNPALGFYGVGSGTRIEFVQVHAGRGDGIAFRGGTANCRWCVSSGSLGDLLDWSEGWSGSAQHLFLRQGDGAGHGIHGHGNGGNPEQAGLPAVFNATLVGGADVRPSGAVGDGIRLSGGAALTGGNWVVVDFRGLAVQAGEAEVQRVGNGGEGFRNLILHGNGGGRWFDQVADSIRPLVDFSPRNPELINVRNEPSPDPRPARGSVALDGLAAVTPPAAGGPWDSAPYAGAFGSWLWTEEWTFFGRETDLRFVRLPVLSVDAASAGEGDVIEFVVRMQPQSQDTVTVRYHTASGTATAGADFIGSSGTLAFPPGETVQTISVPIRDDEIPEEAEHFLIRLTEPTNAELAGRARALERRGTIYGNDMQPLEVPPTWRLVPTGIAAGESFRLLFVSSTARDASAYGITAYDDHVRTAAAAGHASIRPYSGHFRVLASTKDVDARAHTLSTHDSNASQTGVPIYWVGGGQVADDYRDFYSGSWSSNAPTDEFGNVVDPGIEVFTGSASDGTRDPGSRWLGTQELPAVRIGKPGESGDELDAGQERLQGSELRFYGLSDVFAVTQARLAHLHPLSATVDGQRLELTYEESLDTSRPPSTHHFTVKVGGVVRTVSEVVVEGPTVVLRLERPVHEDESVTVSYHTLSHRPTRLRGGSGRLVAVFGDRPVSNETTLVLSVAPAGIEEGAHGEAPTLDFEFSLNVPSSSVVSVDYVDTGTGTATPNVDYEARVEGTVIFAPGQVSRIVSVRVLGDDIPEPSETVVLRISGVENAILAGAVRTLDIKGTILNDDSPRIRVPRTWRLTPPGLAVGDSFRLLFVSSVGRDGRASEFAEYDGHVRAAAAGGHGALRPFSDNFQVLASFDGLDARDHTVTRYNERDLGLPIYWLGGDKVADDYRDFYDGDWDSNDPRNEFGGEVGSGVEVFTGTASDGTGHAEGRVLGSEEFAGILLGHPGQSGNELDSGSIRREGLELGLYGLSGVFVIVPPSGRSATLRSATVNGDELRLAYSEALDSDGVPAAADFEVSVGGVARSVLDVAIAGESVMLRLAERVVIGESVSVTYTQGQQPLFTAVGLATELFSGHPVTNETPFELSVGTGGVLESGRGSTRTLAFEVTLPVPADRVVTVAYADSEEGTATSGSDYVPLEEGTLVFEPGEVSKTVAVTVTGDDLEEVSETVILRLSDATNVALPGGGETLDAVGTIFNDDAQKLEVPVSWRLIPAGLSVGDSFRLLFVSSLKRDSRAVGLAEYDGHVRAAAAGGHGAVRPFSDHFRVLASSDGVDARDHTVTLYDDLDSGPPIYWLGGDRVADDYRDFYDGSWDSNEPRDEFGDKVGSGVEVFTGTASDGTGHAEGRVVGSPEFAGVLLGQPGTNGRELDSGSIKREGLELSLYGLSGVFVIAPPSGQAAMLSAATVTSDELTLAYGEALDSDAVPDAADFEVTVGGVARSVLDVAVAGSSVTLRLAERVAINETVSVTYIPGLHPLRTALGTPADSFSGRPVVNETPVELLFGSGSVLEGGSGSTRILAFEITLAAPTDQVVSVGYRDSQEGTAVAGSDYVPFGEGTIVFEPGEVSRTVTVTVLGDDLEEISETVILRFTGATNAKLAGGAEALDAVGTIFNDDARKLSVPANWGLIPEGLGVGDSFRLLFVSSTKHDARALELAAYDSYVRAAAAGGHEDVQSLNDHFRILASSHRIDARDHIVMLYDELDYGLPIYWLGGDKVADDYRDFYDGNWDSNDPTNESGGRVGRRIEVFTGTASDGTKHADGRFFGSLEFGQVSVGRPGENGKELDSGTSRRRGLELSLYGISGVFQIVPMGESRLALSSAAVDGARLKLTYLEALDPEYQPDPRDFTVIAAGSPIAISKVEAGAAGAMLTLASEVAVGATVTVGYVPGQVPMRSLAGIQASSLADVLVENLTRSQLSIGEAVAREGEPLEFSVRLSRASPERVTVRYGTRSGTATETADYVAVLGLLSFFPGETAKTLLITTLHDDQSEAVESVSMVLSDPTNAWFVDGQAEAVGIGRILDADTVAPVPVPPTWDAVPDGVSDGGSFRLLFVTSQTVDASSDDIARYDRHVMESASSSESRIAPFATYVRALASTPGVDARDHTATLATEADQDVSVHWLGGERVADHYGDLYDGNWDSNKPTDESGNPVSGDARVFTGSTRSGTKDSSGAHLGSQQAFGILVGRPAESGRELDSGEASQPLPGLPLYGLTGVFRVDARASLPATAAGVRLALAPSRVSKGTASIEVEATVTLAGPAAEETEWALRVRGAPSVIASDVSATPSVLYVTVPAGRTTGKGTFTLSLARLTETVAQCQETLIVEAVPKRRPQFAAATPTAALHLADLVAESATCAGLAGITSGKAVYGTDSDGWRTRAAAKPRPSSPGPPGTSARLDLSTDLTAYAHGQPLRVLRALGPEGDDRSYTFFYYLEEIRTGRRYYFSPETGSNALSERVVDAFGMEDGAFAAKRIPIIERELAWEGTVPEAGSWQFVAEVRSADAARVVKTAHAKFLVSARQPVHVSEQDRPADIVADHVWKSETVHKLRGPVRVRVGATLVIEAGTLVQALGSEARIVVEPGGRIEVRGTRSEPVVMTCDAPVGSRAAGCWGGLTVMGRALERRRVGGEARFEAAVQRGLGGDVIGDSSGTLRYLRVEFAGGGSPPSPAIFLHGVGQGTTIEFVQSHESLGSGIELRGGDVRIDYCVSSGARGNSFAWSEGWRGAVGHLFVRQGPQGGHGISAVGSGGDTVAAGWPVIQGATLVGGGPREFSGVASDGIRLRKGARLKAESLIVTGFAGSAIGAGGAEGGEFLAGRSGVRNAIIHSNGGLYGVAQVAASVAPYVDFLDMDPRLRNVRYERNPDPRPRIDSGAMRRNALEGAPVADGIGENPAYTGAFGAWDWTEEWTVFGRESDSLVQFESMAARQRAQYLDRLREGINGTARPAAFLAGRDRTGSAASTLFVLPFFAATSSPEANPPERVSVALSRELVQDRTSRPCLVRPHSELSSVCGLGGE